MNLDARIRKAEECAGVKEKEPVVITIRLDYGELRLGQGWDKLRESRPELICQHTDLLLWISRAKVNHGADKRERSISAGKYHNREKRFSAEIYRSPKMGVSWPAQDSVNTHIFEDCLLPTTSS